VIIKKNGGEKTSDRSVWEEKIKKETAKVERKSENTDS
jgi:hypothetical protein